MPKAIRFNKPGGPEVLTWEEVPVGKPGPGEARVRHTAVGLNFVDVYIRRGLYPVPLPSGLGTKSLGATVIGTVGNEEKAKIAKAHGCDHPIIYTREHFVARVGELTHARKLPVVYDSVGKDTFMKSLDCLRPKGMMVSFGQSSGPVGPVDLGIFGQKGSLFFTRPTLNAYAAARSDLLAMAKDLFEVVRSGAVKIEINQTYPLKDAAQAQTIGSTVFIV